MILLIFIRYVLPSWRSLFKLGFSIGYFAFLLVNNRTMLNPHVFKRSNSLNTSSISYSSSDDEISDKFDGAI